MKDQSHIEKLLRKYYAGESTLQEEDILKDFFEGDKVPDHLQSEADFFRFFSGKAKETSPDLESALDQFIHTRNAGTSIRLQTSPVTGISRRPGIRRANRMYWLGGAAAAILLLIGIFIDIHLENQEYGVVRNDTFEDPNQAYQEAKNIMYYVSETMNSGTAPLQQLEKLDEGVNYIHPMFSFGSGIEHLEHLNRIQRTKQLIEKQ